MTQEEEPKPKKSNNERGVLPSRQHLLQPPVSGSPHLLFQDHLGVRQPDSLGDLFLGREHERSRKHRLRNFRPHPAVKRPHALVLHDAPRQRDRPRAPRASRSRSAMLSLHFVLAHLRYALTQSREVTVPSLAQKRKTKWTSERSGVVNTISPPPHPFPSLLTSTRLTCPRTSCSDPSTYPWPGGAT